MSAHPLPESLGVGADIGPGVGADIALGVGADMGFPGVGADISLDEYEGGAKSGDAAL